MSVFTVCAAVERSHTAHIILFSRIISSSQRRIFTFRDCFSSARPHRLYQSCKSHSRADRTNYATNASQSSCSDPFHVKATCTSGMSHSAGLITSTLAHRSDVCYKNISRKAHQRCFSSKGPFELNRKLSRDVLVFSHKNDNFYKLLSYFGLFQLVVWGYMAFFAVQYLKRAPASLAEDTSNLPWWKRFLYKEGQYKNALSIICLFVGGTVLFITMTYPRRVIRDLWILKGGNDVKMSTYSWFGKTQSFKKPVEHLDCMESRTGRGPHVPIKVKGRQFYYLLDKQGTFHNTELFDFVIGVKRNLK